MATAEEKMVKSEADIWSVSISFKKTCINTNAMNTNYKLCLTSTINELILQSLDLISMIRNVKTAKYITKSFEMQHHYCATVPHSLNIY